MKKILNYLFEHKSLSREQAKEVLHNISKKVYSDAEIAAFITVYLMRSISIDELQASGMHCWNYVCRLTWMDMN